MTQFIDSKMKNSGKLEEIKPRTDSGRPRYMETEIMQTGWLCGHKPLWTFLIFSGEAPCHLSLLDQEPVPSGVDTQTVRADMFIASSEINIGGVMASSTMNNNILQTRASGEI